MFRNFHLFYHAYNNDAGEDDDNQAAIRQTSDGAAVDLYTLADGKVEVRIMNYGGIIVSLRAPDREGKLDDVVLGL